MDMMHLVREATGLDHENIMIACAVNEAAKRPLLVGPNAPLHLVDVAEPRNDLRGSISRLAVSKVIGLPRETVRRKGKRLLEAGMLVEAVNGEVRPIRALMDP